jgi:hypothetical protein
VLLAELPEIAAGATSQDQQVTTTTEGRAALTGFAKNYETPFRVFGRTIVTVASNDPVPSGSIDVELSACFRASISP